MLRTSSILFAAALCGALFSGGCGDDDDTSADTSNVGAGNLDAGSSLLDAATAATQGDGQVASPAGDGGPSSTPSSPIAPPSANSVYVVGSNIQNTNESTLYLWTSKTLENPVLDRKQAIELSGGSAGATFNGAVYVTNSEKSTITRYELVNDALVAGPTLSLAGQGLQYLAYLEFLDAEHAYIVNSAEYKILEWNPTTMKITTSHDISALKRAGWGDENRNTYIRKSDGKIFFQWVYTNERADFVNNYILAVFDTKTKSLSFEEDTTCPATAGFGGFFDENEDLYLIADSFGLFTQFGGFKDPKPACLLRVKKGESKLDPSFKQHPSDALGGRFPWGFYYLGNGLAFTSAIDPEVTKKYNSVFEILFAPEHSGYLLNLRDGSAKQISGLPKDGVGFDSHRTDGRLFVPRSTGSVTIENIKSTESTLFEIKADASAVPLFKLPGYINPVTRVR